MLDLGQDKVDGSYLKQLTRLARVQFLIFDNWGLKPQNPAHSNDLMKIMGYCHGQTSTLVINHVPTDQYHASIGDNTIADAIMDRLMHNAHRFLLKVESMRKLRTQLTEDKHLR